MTAIKPRRLALTTCLALLLAAAFAAAAPGTKTITFADLMKFRAIGGPVISEDGKVVAYGLQPDRGDGEAVVHVLATGKTHQGAAWRLAGHLEERPVRRDGREGAVRAEREDRQGQAEAGHGARRR